MGTDAVLSGASQRADAHHRRFSRSPRLASLILSPSLTPLQLSQAHHHLSRRLHPATQSRAARDGPSASPCRSLGIRVYPCSACQTRNPSPSCAHFSVPFPLLSPRFLPFFLLTSFSRLCFSIRFLFLLFSSSSSFSSYSYSSILSQ